MRFFLAMPTLIIGGTTAAGKSAIAIELAERYGARIVSADAMTVYRGLDIGTAKPSSADRVRVHHACIDIRDPDQAFSVADFVDVFEAEAASNERILVVGGTPFYLAALLRPLAAMPSADPTVRARFDALENPHSALQEIDPITADRLHPNDRLRVIRALEVHALSGKTLTELHSAVARSAVVRATCVWMDRDDLAQRVADRLHQMLENGYLAEVEGLLDAGWDSELKPLRSFAYRYMIAHLRGEHSLDEAIRLTTRDTWRFARKQRTWARGMGWTAVAAEAVHAAAKTAFESI
jgi:tRNA dimethylallyltransferase